MKLSNLSVVLFKNCIAFDHAFIKSGDCVKQIPLAFCFMSRRRQWNYEDVLRALIESLPEQLTVVEFVMDFEQAAWKAVLNVFPQVVIRDCAFHWSQSIWHKI